MTGRPTKRRTRLHFQQAKMKWSHAEGVTERTDIGYEGVREYDAYRDAYKHSIGRSAHSRR